MFITTRLKPTIGIGFPMGGHTGNPFGLSEKILAKGGYLNWLQEEVKPWYDRGCRLALVHRPLGEGDENPPMDLDSAIHLAASEHSYIIDDFRDVKAIAAKQMPDLLWIDYYGTFESNLDQMFRAGNNSGMVGRMFASVQYSLDDPNTMYAQDAASWWPDEHPMEAFVSMIRACKNAQGLPTFCEALPNLESTMKTWQKSHHAICTEKFYQSSRRMYKKVRFSSEDYYTIRWLTNHDPALTRQFSDVLNFSYDCATQPNQIPVVSSDVLKRLQASGTIQDWVNKIGDLMKNPLAEVSAFWRGVRP